MVNSFQKIKMHIKKRRFDGRNSCSIFAHVLQLCHGVSEGMCQQPPESFHIEKFLNGLWSVLSEDWTLGHCGFGTHNLNGNYGSFKQSQNPSEVS